MKQKRWKTDGYLRIFASYYRPHWKLFALDMVCALCICLVDLAFPIVSRFSMQTLLPGQMFTAFFVVMAVLAGAYVLKGCFYYIITYWGHLLGVRMEADIRRDLFSHMQDLSFSFYDKNRTGQLMSRVTGDLFEITELAHHGPEDLFISSITILGAFCVMLTIRWELALIVFAVIPLFILFTTLCRKRMMRASTEVKAKLADMKHGESLIREEVTEDDIAAVVSKWTGIPVSRMMQSERQKLLHLEDELHKRVVGQEMAITALADAVRRNRAGLQDAKRPIGSFIFLGTTGVGKTELAKALAEFLFDDESLMTRIDMSEYQERHSVSRLIGAPPGYVGYDEGGQLTEAVRRKPYSVVLLDEIEKAHPDVFNILLQVLDDGRLTDNKGRVVDFKNTIIIMTSNIGAHIIQERLKGIDENNRDEVLDKTNHEVYEMLKQTIRPEFLNRIDEIIMFAPLKKSEIVDIVRLQFNGVKKMLENNGIAIEITDKAVQWLADAGYDPQFGARPVKRVIQRTLLNDLSKQILAEEVSKDSRIVVDVKDDKIVFENK